VPIWAAPPKVVADIASAAEAEKPAAMATTPKEIPKPKLATATGVTACHPAGILIDK
jgi:hypothetical protein